MKAAGEWHPDPNLLSPSNLLEDLGRSCHPCFSLPEAAAWPSQQRAEPPVLAASPSAAGHLPGQVGALDPHAAWDTPSKGSAETHSLPGSRPQRRYRSHTGLSPQGI